MVRLLLTGGTGFVGRSFLRMVLREQTEPEYIWIKITVMSRSPERFKEKYPEFDNLPWLGFCEGDVMKPSSFPKYIEFTHCMHAATDSANRDEYTNLDRHEQIVLGTRNMLSYSVQNNIGKFAFISSGAAYGRNSGADKLHEKISIASESLQTNNAYAVAKYEAEHLCALYGEAYGIEYVIARCFSFIGPDLLGNSNFAIVNFIFDALQNEAIIVKGDGLAQRTYLYQDDMALWLKIILLQGVSGQAYNVGSDEVVSISELAHMVRDLISPEKPVKVLGKNERKKSKVDRYVPDISKAKFELGLTIEFPLENSIQKTVNIIKRRPS